MNELSKHPDLIKYDKTNVEIVFVTGAVLTKTLREEFLRNVCKHKVHIMGMYGSSEVGILTEWHHLYESPNSEKATSVGTLCNATQMKVSC